MAQLLPQLDNFLRRKGNNLKIDEVYKGVSLLHRINVAFSFDIIIWARAL